MGEKMNISNEKLLNAILNSGGAKINKNDVEKAKKGDISGLSASLDKENRQKLNEALKSKEKAKELLNSKEAREIIKNLSGGNKNG